ncbi:hypothetical protein E3T41_14775 [Cryobacterium sp. Hh38]|nr:hypothetical protein E3T41_14775 [Cryobacterium sp. Hh38]
MVPPKAIGMIGANFISSNGESAAISSPMIATIRDTIDCRPKLLPNALIWFAVIEKAKPSSKNSSGWAARIPIHNAAIFKPKDRLFLSMIHTSPSGSNTPVK